MTTSTKRNYLAIAVLFTTLVFSFMLYNHSEAFASSSSGPLSIVASYNGPDIPAGERTDKVKQTVDKYTSVSAIYTSGPVDISSKVTITPYTISTIGANNLTVKYTESGKTYSTTLTVPGREPTIKSITASYPNSNKKVLQNKAIDKNDISVTAYDEVGQSKKLTASDEYTLTPTIATTPGYTDVTVTYKGATTTIKVPTEPLAVTKLTAIYAGPVLEVGKTISKDNIVVTATYNDGSAKNVSDYVLSETVIKSVGWNEFTVVYTYNGKAYNAKFKVKGVEPLVTGTETFIRTMTDGSKISTLTIYTKNEIVRRNFKPVLTDIPTSDKSKVRAAVRRVNKTTKYLAFNIDFTGYDFDKNNYVTVDFTIPSGFNPANTALYFTPDLNEKMAEVPGGLINLYTKRGYIYRSGTYVIMEKKYGTAKYNKLREDTTPSPIFVVYNAPSIMTVKEIVHIKPTLLYSTTVPAYNYETSDTSILTIDAKGKLKAIKKGKADVIVRSTDGKYSYRYTVTVQKATVKKKTTTEGTK